MRTEQDFVDRAEAVVRLGSLLLAAGTGSYRIKRAMDRAAEALGMDRHDADVQLTQLTVTVYAGDRFRTLTRQVAEVGVDASRIEALENLSRDLTPGMTAAALDARLDRVERLIRPRWGGWRSAVASGLACAAFALLNRFSFSDSCVVLPAAMLGQLVKNEVDRRRLNPYAATAVSAMVAGLAYWLISSGVDLTSWGTRIGDTGYVASLLFLIPGFPMITSLLDMARMDFSAGISRGAHAVAVVLAATLSAWVLSYVTGLQPLPANADYVGATFWVMVVLATFIGVAGFALLFNASRRMALAAAVLAVGANLVRFLLLHQQVPEQLVAGAGGLLLGLAAAVISPRLRIPRITLTVPACVIMVPGAAMYRTVYWLNADRLNEAIDTGADAVLTVLMLAAGLVAARMLTDRDWAIVRPVASPHAFREP